MKRIKWRVVFVLLFCRLAGPAVAQNIEFLPVTRATVEERLRQFANKNSERKGRLQTMFEAAGCRDGLAEQTVAITPSLASSKRDVVVLLHRLFDNVLCKPVWIWLIGRHGTTEFPVMGLLGPDTGLYGPLKFAFFSVGGSKFRCVLANAKVGMA